MSVPKYRHAAPATTVGWHNFVPTEDEEDHNPKRQQYQHHSALDDGCEAEAVEDHVVCPEDVELLNNAQPLGKGACSAAYRCIVHFPARRGGARPPFACVVKIPIDIDVPHNARYLPQAATLLSTDAAWDSFEREYNTVCDLLEPSGRTNRLIATPSDREELKRMRAHPGFAHIHTTYHVELDAPYPMLFSALCDGTLESYVDEELPFEGPLDPVWQDMARQILYGVSYLWSRGWVHLDLHMGNVFFVFLDRKKGKRQFLLSDFNECTPLEHNPGAGLRVMLALALRDCMNCPADELPTPWSELLLVNDTDDDDVPPLVNRLMQCLDIPPDYLLDLSSLASEASHHCRSQSS